MVDHGESTLDKDSSVYLIYHDPNDLGSLILIWNAPQDLPIELELKVRSIGMIRVRTSDPRSLGAQHIKVIDKSTPGNDSSVPSMLHGPSDLWSLILVGIFPKERIVALKVKAGDAENLFTCILHPFQKKGAYAKATFGCEIVNIWNK